MEQKGYLDGLLEGLIAGMHAMVDAAKLKVDITAFTMEELMEVAFEVLGELAREELDEIAGGGKDEKDSES